MAARGGSKVQKRMSAPRSWHIMRKQAKFVSKVKAGPHSKETAMPLIVFLRDMLKVVRTRSECKKVLNEGKVLVNQRVVKQEDYSVGFLDTITLHGMRKNYRVIYDHLGRLNLHETDDERARFKLCRVEVKKVAKGGKMQLTFNDGKTILYEDKGIKVGDVVKMKLPTGEIEELLPLQEGYLAYITGGSYAGQSGRITEIIPGTSQRTPRVKFDGKETTKNNVFIIGKEEPLIKLG